MIRSDELPILEKEIKHSVLFGLLVRRECWKFSIAGKVVVASLILLVSALSFFGLYPFLATTGPVDADYLVAEGWIPAYALDHARVLYEGGSYRKLLTCGAVAPNEWSTNSASNYADWAAAKLRRLGLAAGHVESVPAGEVHADRTYASAVAIREWLGTNVGPVRAINLVSLGPHARRSRLMFQKAFGDDVQIGIISVPDRQYQADRWWQSSEGVREVIGEMIAYVYARFVFSPSKPSAPK